MNLKSLEVRHVMACNRHVITCRYMHYMPLHAIKDDDGGQSLAVGWVNRTRPGTVTSGKARPGGQPQAQHCQCRDHRDWQSSSSPSESSNHRAVGGSRLAGPSGGTAAWASLTGWQALKPAPLRLGCQCWKPKSLSTTISLSKLACACMYNADIVHTMYVHGRYKCKYKHVCALIIRVFTCMYMYIHILTGINIYIPCTNRYRHVCNIFVIYIPVCQCLCSRHPMFRWIHTGF